MRNLQSILVILILVLALQELATHVFAADSTTPSPYRVLSTNQITQFEKELNQNARRGWRLKQLADEWDGNTLNAVLWLPPSPQEVTYEYKVLATRRALTLSKELAATATQGYELRGGFSLSRPVDIALSNLLCVGGETVLVLERPVGQITQRFEYILHTAIRGKTLESKINQSAQQGYAPVAMIRGQNTSLLRTTVNLGVTAASQGVSGLIGLASFVTSPSIYTAVMGRSSGAAQSASLNSQYRFLSARGNRDLEKRLNKFSEAGFRPIIATPGLALLLERADTPEIAQLVKYKCLSFLKTDKLEEQMKKESQQGWQYHAVSNSRLQTTVILAQTLSAPASAPVKKYQLLSAWREKSLQRQLDQMSPENQRVVGFALVLFRPLLILESVQP